ncbi:UDP-2,3-diacylglucosamine diphosphatase [Geoalkalibacter sp.]|uniref:UDP-2,3-diacylglucosamine diphosphatase n=1 Tax=Geoalkalibacter sp. TaxID=3041440 RepID=UPI00272E8BB2|nr:UDP-2,3-diacylglucosamine diphosphatase [Geoalkalibacter sp.]
MNRDIFLADAHLLSPADANYRRLLAFLGEQRGQLRTLYILGDLFEFWVGYRHLVFTPYVPLLNALGELRAAGSQIVYVEGNHDFHLGPYFRDLLGCRVLPDGGEVSIDGKRVHLTHGDLINGSDRGYRLLRRFLRSRLLQGMIALAPGDLTWAISRWASRQSQKGQDPKAVRRLPQAQITAFARKQFAAGCELVVTGHFHQAFQLDLNAGQIIGLGDWIDQYSYLLYENGRFELKTY